LLVMLIIINTSTIMLKIYLPRVEHDKDYIANAFRHYGTIEDIIFMPKTDNNGNTYNGAIVSFNDWNMNYSDAVDLLEYVKADHTDSYKFYHYKQKFWYVNEYKDLDRKKYQLTNIIEDAKNINNNNNNDFDQIKLKILFLEAELERSERRFMEYEMKQLTDSLYNRELLQQIDMLNASNNRMKEQHDEHIQTLSAQHNAHINDLSAQHNLLIKDYDYKLVTLALQNHKLQQTIDHIDKLLASKENIIDNLCNRLKFK
jgi:hypothetical protein